MHVNNVVHEDFALFYNIPALQPTHPLVLLNPEVD